LPFSYAALSAVAVGALMHFLVAIPVAMGAIVIAASSQSQAQGQNHRAKQYHQS
jgi:hypothetical protein